MPSPGAIICDKDFEFEDGSRKEKLFVVLNSADGNNPCLVLKTTSQSKRYSNVNPGCNVTKRVFFIPVGFDNCFKTNTYVQLPQIFEFSASQLIQDSWLKKVSVTNSLSSKSLAQLRNCLKKFKQDLSQRHWTLIYKN